MPLLAEISAFLRSHCKLIISLIFILRQLTPTRNAVNVIAIKYILLALTDITNNNDNEDIIHICVTVVPTLISLLSSRVEIKELEQVLMNLANYKETNVAIVNAGAIPIVVSLLKSDVEIIRIGAVLILRNLVYVNKENQAAIVAANVIPMLISFLSCPIIGKTVATTLSELLKDNKENHVAIVRAGAIPIILSSLTKDEVKDETTVVARSYFFLLARLIEGCEEARDAIISRDTILILIKLLKAESSAIVRQASLIPLSSIAQFAKGREIIKAIFKEINVLNDFIFLLKYSYDVYDSRMQDPAHSVSKFTFHHSFLFLFNVFMDSLNPTLIMPDDREALNIVRSVLKEKLAEYASAAGASVASTKHLFSEEDCVITREIIAKINTCAPEIIEATSAIATGESGRGGGGSSETRASSPTTGKSDLFKAGITTDKPETAHATITPRLT